MKRAPVEKTTYTRAGRKQPSWAGTQAGVSGELGTGLYVQSKSNGEREAVIQPRKVKRTQIRWSVVGYVKKNWLYSEHVGEHAATLLGSNSCLLLSCFVGEDLKENVAVTSFRKKNQDKILTSNLGYQSYSHRFMLFTKPQTGMKKISRW